MLSKSATLLGASVLEIQCSLKVFLSCLEMFSTTFATLEGLRYLGEGDPVSKVSLPPGLVHNPCLKSGGPIKKLIGARRQLVLEDNSRGGGMLALLNNKGELKLVT
jgi:hypothetical protein